MVVRAHARFLLVRLSLTVGLVVPASGCSPRTVHVGMEVPNEKGELTPVPGVRFVVLPYDRDSLLAELERQSPEPRPATGELDSLLAAFRAPFTRYLRAAAEEVRVRAVRDSLRQRLDGVGRGEPEYAALYQQFSALEDSLRALEPALEAARAALARARTTILPRADSLRRELVAWENSAYRSYDSLTSALVWRSRREPITDSTRADGWAAVRVPSGEWWVYARAVNVLDPNAEWYWNVKVSEDTVRLTPATGRSRLRL